MTTPTPALRNAHLSSAVLASWHDLWDRHLSALALRVESTEPLALPAVSAALALHLFGLAAFWRYYHQPVWLAVPTLLVSLTLPFAALRFRRTLAIETLAPLFFLYLVLIARVIAVRVLLANEPYQDEASFADARLVAFQVEATVGAVIAYLALVQTACLAPAWVRSRVLMALGLALGMAAVGWFAVETVGHRTRGVTATDPYAYVQMAVDLAERGTPLHGYDLFPNVVNLGISWYPIEHIGYRLFNSLTGWVPTVWPVGGSVALAILYRTMGEEGLYLGTPLVAIVSLAVLGWFAWEYSARRSWIERAATAGLAVLLLATSWEQVDRSIVPLVDVQAQLLTVLALLFALKSARGGRRGSWLLPFLTGAALGGAYLVRHTQVLVAVAIVIAVWAIPIRERLRFLAIAGFAALVVAVPDLWYHQLYFGSWQTPESHELALFALSNVLPSLDALSARFLAGNEFGYLIPFLLYGTYRAFREDRSRFLVLVTWIGMLGGFHLLYSAVKIRDLLAEYPAVILITAYGMVAIARDARTWAGANSWRRLAVAIVIYVTLLLPSMRDRLTILRPFQPAKVTFGYVTEIQRTSFERVAEMTPPNAVVGSTMNDGAVDLYAHRATFRPGAWPLAERIRFLEAMQSVGRPVYWLEDGTEMSAARRELGDGYSFQPVVTLDVPLFGETVDQPGTLFLVTGPP